METKCPKCGSQIFTFWYRHDRTFDFAKREEIPVIGKEEFLDQVCCAECDEDWDGDDEFAVFLESEAGVFL